MRIFVSEYVCGGGWESADLPGSLAAEGESMLAAVTEDLSEIPGMHVVTTRDARLATDSFPRRSNVEVKRVDSTDEEAAAFRQLVSEADGVLVIAPETGGILERRCRQARTSGAVTCNADPRAIGLTADKLAMAEFCRQWDIPTLPTALAETVADDWGRTVVKVRDGAGSMRMQLFDSLRHAQHWIAGSGERHWIVQPYVRGRSLSMAGIFDSGELVCLFPVAEQRLSSDGRFRYLGGRIPAGCACEEQLVVIVRAVAQHLPGLHGYIGFDFLIPEACPDGPLLVEINPRLTTSYVGYRQLCRENLGHWLILGTGRTVPRFHGAVEFMMEEPGNWTAITEHRT